MIWPMKKQTHLHVNVMIFFFFTQGALSRHGGYQRGPIYSYSTTGLQVASGKNIGLNIGVTSKKYRANIGKRLKLKEQ